MKNRQTIAELYTFVSHLRHRDRQLHVNADRPAPHSQSLVLADALLRHSHMRGAMEGLPAQLVVIGPTQAGKSTLVNLLLGTEAATASPLAGFTRHAQGFTPLPIDDVLKAGIQSLLPEWQLLAPEQLDAEKLDSFSLQQIPQISFPEQNFVLWDTPDFDSVHSRNYRATVPVMCAMADAIVLIVSKEKYADQSVWDILQLLAPIEKPLGILINKVAPENATALQQAMQKKLDQAQISCGHVFTLPYLQDTREGTTAIAPLRDDLQQRIHETPHITPAEKLRSWLMLYWDAWVEPVRKEIAAKQQWETMLSSGQEEALQYYAENYLQQPQYSETLQQAIVRLLELLEIPAVSGGLQSFRKLITWPARKLGGLIKKQANVQPTGSNDSQEFIMIREACEHYLTGLHNSVIHHADEASTASAWWKNLEQAMQKNDAVLKEKIKQAIEAHKKSFAPEIERTANEWYEYLQEHPVTLNSLRTARISADAAAVVLAIKTGGVSLHDLALAPAFVAVTSFLTESAVGQQMKKTEARLKQKQQESLRKHLFEDALLPTLMAIPDTMSKENLYNISETELKHAETALEKLDA